MTAPIDSPQPTDQELLPAAPTRSNRPAAVVAAFSGLAAIAAAYLTWFRIEIDGKIAPGSLESGFDGRDGQTIVLVGGGVLVVALLLAVGRADAWLKGALLVGGGLSLVVAVVNLYDASGKAQRIEEEFGIPAAAVSARAGEGLWVLAAASVGLLAAGFMAKRRAVAQRSALA